MVKQNVWEISAGIIGQVATEKQMKEIVHAFADKLEYLAESED